ncbi:MAG: ATP-binding protein [Burkholderiaceae bacterium]|nr:ATP-binding protein [Burkholderiaceae bacterium]
MASNTDLQDLIDTRKETLEVEYKQWLDLRDNVVRAKLARHIAALANHGGGYIVFGFKDDMTPDQNRPGDLGLYNSDAFSGIVKRYLTPAVHCDVKLVEETSSRLEYPVVRIPSHGVVPVCASQNGPDDAKGKPQGVVKGTYYVRALGPASEAITGPELWQPLIRRCVLNERDGLLRSFTQVLNGQLPTGTLPAKGLTLREWHDRSRDKFLEYVINKTSGEEWYVPINTAHFQFSYRILQDEEDKVPVSGLLQVLHQANNEVKNVIYDGWSMFFPFQSDDLMPYTFVNEIGGIELEGYEANLLKKGEATRHPDFWRFAEPGWASIILVYSEDGLMEDHPKNYIDPDLLAKNMAEVLLHALAMAKHFSSAHSIELLCTWTGLKNRVIQSVDSAGFWSHRSSNTNSRKSSGTWAIPYIDGSLSTVVSELINPVLRLFDAYEVTPESIERTLKKFHTPR